MHHCTTRAHGLVLGALISLLPHTPARGAELKAWPVDPLVKVMHNLLPPDRPAAEVAIEAARGEIENGLIAYRCDQPVARLVATAGALRGPAGQQLAAPQVRYLGYVLVKHNTEAHLDETGPVAPIAAAPAEFPDPLLEDSAVGVQADETGGVWLTVTVPPTAEPGLYRGEIALTADGVAHTVPISVQVYAATVPARMNLKVVNWYFPGTYTHVYGVTRWSDDYWRLVEAEAQKMAAHRFSAGYVILPETITVVERADGGLDYDFAHFDRQVEIFRRAGLPWIVGSHLAARNEWMAADFDAAPFPLKKADGTTGVIPAPEDPKSSDKDKQRVYVAGDRYRQWLAKFLPALQQHLADKGWLDGYLQHLTDEPTSANAAAYVHLGQMVKQYAPRLRRLDAVRTRNLIGGLDVWVPLSSDLEHDIAFYRERQKAGDEVWFYTCERPRGLYMNRFIDQALLRTRLLHWLHALYGSTGFLHWGYNASWGNPFQNADSPSPAGDGCIVYPGVVRLRGAPDAETKLHSLDSLRFEAERDGIEDYELLHLLSQQDRPRADAIVAQVIKSAKVYTVDPVVFRAARRQLLEALSRPPAVLSLQGRIAWRTDIHTHWPAPSP